MEEPVQPLHIHHSLAQSVQNTALYVEKPRRLKHIQRVQHDREDQQRRNKTQQHKQDPAQMLILQLLMIA